MNLESGVLQVHIEDIIPNRFQPRLNFDEQGLKELSDSIKEHGIIQPLVLRKLGNKYEIIAGERRFKAAQIAGLTTVPAVISNIDDNKSAEVALVENVQRRDLTAIEEARSYKSLLDKGYLTQEQLAKRMGLSQPAIANKLRLLNLDEEVQQALLEEKISERHARTLLSLDKEAQKEWLHRIINERLTVRQLDLEIKKFKEKSAEEEEIPLVESTPTVEEIRANAMDINESRNINKPNNNDIETLDFADDIEKEEQEPETNIASPTSVSPITNPIEISNSVDNKFFNFNLESEDKEQQEETTNNKMEVFDEPNAIDNNDFISSYEEVKEEPVEEQTIPPFEFSSNNRFFTAIDDKAEQEPATEETIINPMDSVDKITPSFNEQEKEEQELGLKDAINTIRDSIKSLGTKGFFINVEEIDFADNYQITIKINKDN